VATLLQSNVIVGFSPAPSAGKPAGGANSAGEGVVSSALGIFGALLDAAKAPDSGTGSHAVARTLAVAPPVDTAPAVAPTALAPAAMVGPSPELLSSEADETFAALVDALAALSDALDAGTPPDPAVEDRIEGLIGTLAELLGLPPARPATPSSAGTDLDALAAIAASATSASADAADASIAASTTSGFAPIADRDAADPLPAAIKGAAAALPDAAKQMLAALGLLSDDAAEPQVQVAATGDAPMAPSLSADPAEIPAIPAKLAQKLAALADTVKPQWPQLAERLAALSTRLASGEIDSALLEKLGLAGSSKGPESEVEQAIERLLAPPTALKAPAEKPFAAANLALPAGLGAATQEEAPALTGSTPAARAADAGSVTEIELKPAANNDAEVAMADNRPARTATPAAAAQASATPGASDPTPAQQAPATAAAPSPTTPIVAAEARAQHAAYRAPVQQINIPQVAFEVARQVQAGNSRFQIRLDPPELGRIDVKLDVDQSGNVNARMTVERAETLDLMQRDQRALERALAGAGLDGNKTHLESSLRKNPSAREEQQFHQQQGGKGRCAGHASPAEAGDEAAPLPQIAYRGLASAGGVNLFV